jgi:hypothetical protein
MRLEWVMIAKGGELSVIDSGTAGASCENTNHMEWDPRQDRPDAQ